MIGYVRRFDASYRDAHDKIAAGAIGRPFLVHSQTADQNDPSGFFVRFAPTSGGILLDMSVHDIDTVRWLLGAGGATRVFATGTIAVHEGLARVRRRRQRRRDDRVRRRARSPRIYASRTMAHGHETLTEIIGTAGRLTVGRNPRLNRVEIADAHGMRNECTPTFYERFAEAFLQRSTGVRRRRRRRSRTAAHIARRDGSDADRHRRYRIAADKAHRRA